MSCSPPPFTTRILWLDWILTYLPSAVMTEGLTTLNKGLAFLIASRASIIYYLARSVFFTFSNSELWEIVLDARVEPSPLSNIMFELSICLGLWNWALSREVWYPRVLCARSLCMSVWLISWVKWMKLRPLRSLSPLHSNARQGLFYVDLDHLRRSGYFIPSVYRKQFLSGLWIEKISPSALVSPIAFGSVLG
jgi:hypothetical protein